MECPQFEINLPFSSSFFVFLLNPFHHDTRSRLFGGEVAFVGGEGGSGRGCAGIGMLVEAWLVAILPTFLSLSGLVDFCSSISDGLRDGQVPSRCFWEMKNLQ